MALTHPRPPLAYSNKRRARLPPPLPKRKRAKKAPAAGARMPAHLRQHASLHLGSHDAVRSGATSHGLHSAWTGPDAQGQGAA